MPNPNEMHRESLESDCTLASYTSDPTNELHRQHQERMLSIHEANYEVFMRRYYNNGERDREYCRELLRNATYSAMEIRRIKNGLAIDEALDRLAK